MASFNTAAKLLSSSFEAKTRDDGSPFIALTSTCPDWVSDAVRAAHEDELPNDERYALIRSASDSIADQCFDDADDARESIWELANDLVPCYTSEILSWFADNVSRLADCDITEDMGGENLTVYDLLTLGYKKAAENVLGILIEAIEDNRTTIFNPDTDCRLLIPDNQGIYIPQLYCQELTEDDAADYGVEWSDVVCCQSGPGQEWYWESWQAILDSAEITEPATLKEDESVWRLHQSGDLWMVRADVELPEDF